MTAVIKKICKCKSYKKRTMIPNNLVLVLLIKKVIEA